MTLWLAARMSFLITRGDTSIWSFVTLWSVNERPKALKHFRLALYPCWLFDLLTVDIFRIFADLGGDSIFSFLRPLFCSARHSRPSLRLCRFMPDCRATRIFGSVSVLLHGTNPDFRLRKSRGISGIEFSGEFSRDTKFSSHSR